ncbi:MAG: sugar ABC transporter ATP-binding protein [Spirochaetota bacterium]
MDYALSARKINKSFGSAHVLRDVSFDLKKGEIHGLLGENGAGKSTLIKIMSGDYYMDSGEILMDGEVVNISKPSDSLAKGIRVIYQEFNLVKTLSVAENIFIGEMPLTKFGLVDKKEMNRWAEELLAELGIEVDVNEIVQNISVAEQQLVEIAKALSKQAQILIMDEPTAALSDQETSKLFDVVRGLKARGKSVIFITHRLSEQFEMADRITVLRDGQTIGTVNSKDVNDDDLVRMMVGRDVGDLYPRHFGTPGEIIFEAKNLHISERVNDISFNIRRGEIVSFFGLMGAGQEAICKALIGDPPIQSGTLFLNGEELVIRNLREANKKGIGYVSSDRKQEGLLPLMSLTSNITTAAFRKLAKFRIFTQKKVETKVTQNWIDRMNIRCRSQQQHISSLSGGNQQKAMISRWLSNDIKLLILNMPTRGVDVGAKAEIYTILEELANNGVAVLVFSLELLEVLGISDRIYVLCEGDITAEVPIKEANQDILMKHAVAKFLHFGGK